MYTFISIAKYKFKINDNIWYFFSKRFIVYKVPRVSARMNPSMTTTGKEIFYMDNGSRFFVYKDIDITGPHQNPLYNTLKQIYDKVSNIVLNGTVFAWIVLLDNTVTQVIRKK